MSIITLNEYKTYAEISSPKYDDKLNTIVDYVNDYIVSYCNTCFSPTVITGERCTYTGNIILPHAPVISVEAVNTIVKGVTTLIDASAYLLDKSTGIIYMVDESVSMPDTPWAISVDFTCGHEFPPPSVVLAAKELVTYYYKRDFKDSKSFSDGESVTMPKMEPIPIHVRTGLDMYKVL